MDQPAIAGEEVSAEEQIKTRAQEAAMALSVAGQMNHAQAAPVGKFTAVAQMFIDRYSAVTKERAPASFQRSAHSAGATIREGAVDMRLLRGVGQHRSSRQSLDLRQVAGVIEVSVGQQDSADAAPVETDLLERASQQPHF